MSCRRGCCPSPAEHFRSVSLATKALVAGNRADGKVARDRAAYKSLKDQGYQPRSLTGAHELARDATSAAEIEGRPDGYDE